MPKVMIEPATYDDCRRAVSRAFELFPIRIAGRKIMVKPNVLRASRAEEAIVTHPAVVRAVVEVLEELGPRSLVVGDNPGLLSYGANEASFRQTGLFEAAKGYYQNIGQDSVEVATDSEFADRFGVSRAIMEADVVISLPKFKTHGLTVMTGAIKNSYGLLPGAQKARLHRASGRAEKFHEAIVDVFRLRVPDLFIMDAIVGMEGNGPTSSELRNIGLMLASDNAVALDATVARLMGLEPDRLRFLRRARELGLGDYDPAAIEIVGRLEPIPDFKLPPLGGEAIATSEVIRDIMISRIKLRPKADPDLCTGCRTCVEQCPVSALTMDDRTPVVAADQCIVCFCCQEICPEKAITLQ
ncbi:MAG: DUF362 domain-containing protein [Thermodesulfobacteriota bacterium]